MHRYVYRHVCVDLGVPCELLLMCTDVYIDMCTDMHGWPRLVSWASHFRCNASIISRPDSSRTCEAPSADKVLLTTPVYLAYSPSICAFAQLPAHLAAHRPAYLPAHLPGHMPPSIFYLCIRPSARLSVHPSVGPFVNPSMHWIVAALIQAATYRKETVARSVLYSVSSIITYQNQH